VGELMRHAGLVHVDITDDDAPLWERQRAGQRSAHRALVRVATRPTALPALLAATDSAGGTLVGRAALGVNYIDIDPAAIETLYGALPSDTMPVIQDAPGSLRGRADPWGPPQPAPVIELMRRLKQRFDPPGACNPGLFVGGL
jgi:glycolate oxidase FAD binding subunit